jgi:hypothetical protein
VGLGEAITKLFASAMVILQNSYDKSRKG